MICNVVLGCQWGDEGKGKIVDLISGAYDKVVRFQGGPNAGHTVVINDKKYALHQVPSGIFSNNTKCVIGSGVILNLESLYEEIKNLEDSGINVKDRIIVDPHTHIIMPWHIDLDYKREENLSLKIGTTKKGIGPCYSDKYARRGTRICDLLSYNKLVLDNAKAACEENIYLKDLYNEHNITEILSSKTNLLNNLISIGYITISNDIFKESDRVLFEGAQSILLDIDHGTYPYVSSSHAGISGILNTYPISPKDIDIVYGIFKPYTTKVGTGPYPSEMDEETSKIIREIGKEYGTTTGRPRRCGWFDSVAAKYAIKTAQITQVALMKLDVLSSFEKIKICTHYELDGNTINYFPKDINILNRCKPIYTEIPGWKENISDVNNWHYLPSEAKSFINFIAQNIGSPIRQVSVGAERNQIIKL